MPLFGGGTLCPVDRPAPDRKRLLRPGDRTMPFTPYHFGLGAALKATLPRYFCFTLFAALQVVTDLETLYNMVHHRWPLHRFLHTFLGAGLLALVASVMILAASRLLAKTRFAPRLQPIPILFTALTATWSHVVLDSIVHSDARPFFPSSDANPFLSLVDAGRLHRGLIVLGVLGGAVWLIEVASRWRWSG
jgi:membrane-bound metal-dependent hydrolase YbcI (DUF457 family)